MMPIRKNYDQNWLPSLFSDFFDTDWMPRMNTTSPAVNVTEDEQEYKIEVAAPGMTKEDFQVSLSDEDHLTISLEKKNEKDEKSEDNKRYLRREFSYSQFQQTLALPEDVDREQISASVTDGVLTIDLRKKAIEAQAPTSRTIEIR